MPQHALNDIALALGGKLMGDGALNVDRLVHPKDAMGPSDLILAFDKSLHPLLDNTPSISVVLGADQEELGAKFKGAVLVPRPRAAMARLTAMFDYPFADPPGIHPSAIVHPTAKIGKDAAIGPLCVIGAHADIGDGVQMESQVTIGSMAVIGANSLIHSGVRVGDRVKIGARAILHFNAVVGSDGFSFVTPERGSAENAKESGDANVTSFNLAIHRIASLGSVILGDDVEVGACSTIDRGTITDTVIGNSTKIDNQVQVGHNVTIGENCMICGATGIAGSVIIGDRVILGGASGVADHVKIGDDSVLSAAAVAASNLPPKGVYMGFPAMPRDRFREQFLYISRLKAMNNRLKAVEAKINPLEEPEKNG
jgi:UDP-3-O-[3-hydroxymyristoyl] glucosamine N-acyltransferase